MAQIPQTEIKSMITDLTPGARNLLLYIYSLNDGWQWRDDAVAIALSTTVRQLKTYKKELIDKQYLFIQKGHVDIYFVGKIAVKRFKTKEQAEEEIKETSPKIFNKSLAAKDDNTVEYTEEDYEDNKPTWLK